MIADSYAWLSECAHPNFLSHASAIEADLENHRLLIHHSGPLRPEELSTIGYLDISAGLFLALFDDMGTRSSRVFGS